MKEQLLTFTSKGIYCSAGDFYIDPWQPVDVAVITHAHGDHARPGSKSYIAHAHTCRLLKTRIGEEHSSAVEYGQTIRIKDVSVTFHPAGHVAGSAQVLVEYKGEKWVVTGDYKHEADPVATAYEPLKCHVLITESTFGLPIYNWQDTSVIQKDINNWCRSNVQSGLNSVLFGYSLGKAQRLSELVDRSIGEVIVHGAIYNIHNTLLACGYDLKPVSRYDPERKYKSAVIIMPPSAAGATWMRKFNPYRTADASGWMAVRGLRRRKAVDKGFVLSDHADWSSLIKTVEYSGAEKIYVTHGYTDQFARYLREKGYDADAVKTRYGDQSLESE